MFALKHPGLHDCTKIISPAGSDPSSLQGYSSHCFLLLAFSGGPYIHMIVLYWHCHILSKLSASVPLVSLWRQGSCVLLGYVMDNTLVPYAITAHQIRLFTRFQWIQSPTSETDLEIYAWNMLPGNVVEVSPLLEPCLGWPRLKLKPCVRFHGTFGLNLIPFILWSTDHIGDNGTE